MTECIICLDNICFRKSLRHVQILLEFNFIEVLINCIRGDICPDGIRRSIDALEDIYETFDSALENTKEERRKNLCLIKLDECNGLETIKMLRSHPNQDICKAVSSFIVKCL